MTGSTHQQIRAGEATVAGGATVEGEATAAGGGTALAYVVCDVFTDSPLAGNQLGVFPDGQGVSTARMQALARELGYSESTFVLPPEAGGDARVRIFTPTRELRFAGHPVLGTAFVVAGQRGLAEVLLETLAGTVPVRFDQGSRPDFGWMDQPLPAVEPFEAAEELLDALGVERSELPVEVYDNGMRHVFVALASEAAVAGLRPDLQRIAGLGPVGINCFAGGAGTWKSRMFGPALGVSEDPATGSAAGPLAIHLARHGAIDWGQAIEIKQGVEIGRPSRLHARAEGGAGAPRRVEVGGSVVIVARGTFSLPDE